MVSIPAYSCDGAGRHEARWEGMDDQAVERVMASNELVVVVKDLTKSVSTLSYLRSFRS